MQLGNILILGDSYSTFSDYIPEGFSTYYRTVAHNGTDVTKVEETWWMQVINSTNGKLLLNSSWSGTTICNTGYNGDDYSDISFIARFDKLKDEGFFKNNTVDTVLVFGGTNDSWAGSPAGEPIYENWTKEDSYKVLPAFSYLLHQIKSNLPNAKIINIVNDCLSAEITNGLNEISNKYGCITVQLENISKVNGHPDIAGMTSIAQQIISHL